MGGGSSAQKYSLDKINLKDLPVNEQKAFGLALKNFAPTYDSAEGGTDIAACQQFEKILENARKTIENAAVWTSSETPGSPLGDKDSESPTTGQISRQQSVHQGHRSSFVIVNEHKRSHPPVTKSSPPGVDENSKTKKDKAEVSVSVNMGSVSPAHFMTALEKGHIRQQSFKDPTGYRKRRGSFSQGVVEDPDHKEVFEERRTTIYASSEIGLQQAFKAPFPPHIMGTFSCHGIAPAEDAEPDDVMRALLGAAGDNDSKGKVHQKTNQDRGCVVYPFAGSDSSAFLMVLDGHGDQGDRVAEFAMRQICLSVETHPDLLTDPMRVLSESFVATNKALVITKEIKAMTSGTTVVAAYMTGNTLYVANVGDSRAVLATRRENGDTCLAKMLSVDHKPDSPEEFERITKKRGYVSMSRSNQSFVNADQSLPSGLDTTGNTVDPVRMEEEKKEAEEKKGSGPNSSISARVWLNPEHTLVGLAMSRSIGDLAVKRVGVIADPDVSKFEIDPVQDKFLLLASDGVWEFIDNQEAVNIVNKNLKYGAHTACQMLIEEAERRWKVEEGDYRDDITAVVITLPIPYRQSNK